MLDTIEIFCKSCGSCTGNVRTGSGPHKYRVDCKECGRFYKWASVLDVEDVSLDQIGAKSNEADWQAIMAAKAGDMIAFFKYTNIRDKLHERISAA